MLNSYSQLYNRLCTTSCTTGCTTSCTTDCVQPAVQPAVQPVVQPTVYNQLYNRLYNQLYNRLCTTSCTAGCVQPAVQPAVYNPLYETCWIHTASCTSSWMNYAGEPSQVALERASHDVYEVIESQQGGCVDSRWYGAFGRMNIQNVSTSRCATGHTTGCNVYMDL